MNQYFGIFFLIFQSSGVWGNLISSLVFGQKPTQGKRRRPHGGPGSVSDPRRARPRFGTRAVITWALKARFSRLRLASPGSRLLPGGAVGRRFPDSEPPLPWGS